MSARCVVDETGKRARVILPIEEYERLMEELGELERGEDELIPLDQAVQEIEEGRISRDGS